MLAIEAIEGLSSQSLGPLTVLAGDDLGQFQELKSRFLQQIGYDPTDLNVSYFDLQTVGFDQVEMDLVSLPFFADYKVIILDHFMDLTTSKKKQLTDEQLKAFEAYLTSPVETAKLVIFAEGNLDSKRRIVKLLKRDGQVFEAKELKEADLKQYFQKMAKKEGLVFENKAFDQLLIKSAYDFSQLTQNIAFLKAYKEDGQIGIQDIEEAIPKSLQDNLFDLTQFLLKGDLLPARNLVADLVLQGEDEVKLIAVMTSQFRILTQVAILAEEGMVESQVVADLSDYLGRKVNPYQVRFALRDGRRSGAKKLKEALSILIETDFQIKSGVYDKDYLLDLALLKIARMSS